MFITHGPLDPRSPLFVGRKAELARMELWLVHASCVGGVLGARQTGKTSLLLRFRHTFHDKYAFAYIDLEAIEGANEEECFSYIAEEMVDQLAGVIATCAPQQPGDSRGFLTFLQSLARETPVVRIAVILDEVGALPRDTAIKLSHTIRAVFTSRLVKQEYARYVFVLAGATDMLQLATGRNSPLRNVTETIYLGDLSLAESEELLSAGFRALGMELSSAISGWIYDWTVGHPYWTQRVAATLAAQGEAQTEDSVKDAIEQLLQVEERNLPHILRALDNGAPQVWATVESLLKGIAVPFSRSDAVIAELELIGAIKNQSGCCAFRNRVYREAIHRHLVKQRRLSSTPGTVDLMSPGINIAAVRSLIRDAFAAKELWRFCQEHPTFRPVVFHFGPNFSLEDMADVLIEYCQTQLLFPELLAEIQAFNPRQYESHYNQLTER